MTSSAATKSVARAVADLSDGVIIATVDINAPIERVFRALTTPAELVRWWGAPNVYTTTDWQMDLRKGGTFVAQGKMADGETFRVEGEYLDIKEHHTLVHTWRADFDGGHVTTVRYRLDALDAGTRVTVRHDGFAGRPESCAGHSSGWELVLDWLGGFLAPAPAKSHFMCKLIAPRPTFPSDMTESEGKLMGEHVAHWQPRLGDGTLLVFGPVIDPKGVWGVAIVHAESMEHVQSLTAGDPIVRAGLGFRYEILPMPQTLVGH